MQHYPVARRHVSEFFLSSVYTSDLTFKLRIIYKRLNLLIVTLFVVMVGVGCGKADKSLAAKRKQQVKNVFESTEVQAKKVAFVNAIKALHVPGTSEAEMIPSLESALEGIKECATKEELNNFIVVLDKIVQVLKTMRPSLDSALTRLQPSISRAKTLEDCLDAVLQDVRTHFPADIADYVEPVVTQLAPQMASMTAEEQQGCVATIQSFVTADARIAIYDTCTDLISEVLAGLKNIKD